MFGCSSHVATGAMQPCSRPLLVANWARATLVLQARGQAAVRALVLALAPERDGGLGQAKG